MTIGRASMNRQIATAPGRAQGSRATGTAKSAAGLARKPANPGSTGRAMAAQKAAGRGSAKGQEMRGFGCGGKVKKYAKGGKIDGCAKRGKTRGKIC